VLMGKLLRELLFSEAIGAAAHPGAQLLLALSAEPKRGELHPANREPHRWFRSIHSQPVDGRPSGSSG
jgi:hypothetical protein